MMQGAHDSGLASKPFVHRPTNVLDPPALSGRPQRPTFILGHRGKKDETNPISRKSQGINGLRLVPNTSVPSSNLA